MKDYEKQPKDFSEEVEILMDAFREDETGGAATSAALVAIAAVIVMLSLAAWLVW